MNFIRKIKSRSFRQNIPTYLALLVGSSILAYFVIYLPVAKYVEKKHFAQAEVSLDNLYNQIVAKIGKPDEVKKDKSCSYASQEFGRGSLGCSVGISVLYKNKNASESSSLMKSSAVVVGTGLRESLGRKQLTSFVSKQDLSGPQSFGQSHTFLKSIACSVSYSYPISPTYINSVFHPTSQENLEIDLNCGGPAKAEYFPLRN